MRKGVKSRNVVACVEARLLPVSTHSLSHWQASARGPRDGKGNRCSGADASQSLALQRFVVQQNPPQRLYSRNEISTVVANPTALRNTIDHHDWTRWRRKGESVATTNQLHIQASTTAIYRIHLALRAVGYTDRREDQSMSLQLSKLKFIN